MKYSLNLLKQYINVDDAVKELANKLTRKSCEIEQIDSRVLPDELVIGYVTKVEQHPDADKLLVCQVDCGSHGTFQVITGGENVREGAFVPNALPGCYLPSIDLKIGERKMRWVDSNGMICAKEELGIMEDTDKHWIWIMNDDCDDLTQEDKGKPVKEKYPRLENHILDVDNKTLTHRPDLTGYFGVAMELNAIYQSLDDSAKIIFNKAQNVSQDMMNLNILEHLQQATSSTRKIHAKTENLRSYVLVELNDIVVKESSFFTRVMLRDIEWQPINNWVDFSNIFMNLSSQPVHFFDADKVKGDIVVRQAEPDEKFTDLNDDEHVLTSNDIVIADQEKIIALAWIYGANNSGVDQNTKNILVEIANFDPVHVRKTALRLALRTDASMRYEKNINPLFTLHCLLLLMDQVQYNKPDLGEVTFAGLDFYIDPSITTSPKTISLHQDQLIQTIWGDGNTEKYLATIQKVLEGLGFRITQNDQQSTVTVPYWRGPGDINIPEDVFEEVARIHGYENIAPLPLTNDVQTTPFPIDIQVIRTIEHSFAHLCGYDQMETYPWADQKLMGELHDHQKNEEWLYQDLLTLKNALSPETKHLRDSMIYNLFSYAAKNSKFFDKFKLFDIGKVWSKKHEKNEELYGVPGQPNHEKWQWGAVLFQKKQTDWSHDLVLKAKSHLGQMFASLWLNGKVEYVPTDKTQFHPKKQGTIIYNRQPIGFLGQLHPLLLSKHKMEQNSQLVYMQIDIDMIIHRYNKKKNKAGSNYETLQDQIVQRDLCFVIDQEKTFGEVIHAVKSVKEVTSLRIFDLYQGEHLPQGKKSIALSMKIVGDGNMTTEQINQIMDKAIEKAQKTGAELRK